MQTQRQSGISSDIMYLFIWIRHNKHTWVKTEIFTLTCYQIEQLEG